MKKVAKIIVGIILIIYGLIILGLFLDYFFSEDRIWWRTFGYPILIVVPIVIGARMINNYDGLYDDH